MSSVLAFPGVARPRPAAPSLSPHVRRSDIDVAGIGRRLRISHLSRRVIIERIRLLIKGHGFPEPTTPRVVKGERLRGAEAVYALSRWPRHEVDDWFDGDLPPGQAAKVREQRCDQVRHELQGRARQLAGVPA